MDKNEEYQETLDKMLYILQKDTLTLEEACLYLGIKASFMYKLTSRRLIPHSVPNGKLIYFQRLELDQWALRNKRMTKEQMEHNSKNYLQKAHR